ncbi:MAG: hypothetical protein RI907_51 [Pseudomonadota bacterium]|jgi:hypothetical protein
MAVCSFCRGTLVREGEALRRIGHSAELFDDHSPLGLGARGSWAGESFTLVGQLQYSYQDDDGEEGRWTAWHAAFDNGRSACLSEDNGTYVLTWPQADAPPPLDTLQALPIGAGLTLRDQRWTLTSRVQARVHAMAGEWLALPDLKQPFAFYELRNPRGEVLSVDTSTQPPQVDLGRQLHLADLNLSGLPRRDDGRANIRARGQACPSCGSALQPTLDTTQSIVCGSCKAVVDISKGLGADLAFYKQDNGLPPLIDLGKRGQLSLGGVAIAWQVVGYQERHNVPASADEESWFWREYLLYNEQAGFAFLVDALDGWSLVQPVTGAPTTVGDKASYQGVDYRKKEESYSAQTTYVLGEFYWPVRKGQKTLNTDYAGSGARANLVLNREMAGQEVTWSAGRALDAQDVMRAFHIEATRRQAFERDVSATSESWTSKALVYGLIIAFFVLVSMIESCGDSCSDVRDTYGENSQEYQQCRASRHSSGGYGGSYGGYTSGGSHK